MLPPCHSQQGIGTKGCRGDIGPQVPGHGSRVVFDHQGIASLSSSRTYTCLR